jgi:ergothioneine biosynthesis protein EgtB
MDSASLAQAYARTRRATEVLAGRLSPEDQQLQSMPDASPTKWHLAHTTWFFEEFVLSRRATHSVFHERFRYLFNSYYEAVGPRHARPQRGVLSRPSAAQILEYRAHVDAAMQSALDRDLLDTDALSLIELGIHHEQQHQELLLTDILHAFSMNAMNPVYSPRSGVDDPVVEPAPAAARDWVAVDGGLMEVGHSRDGGFAFDNEGPRHRVFAEPFELGRGLVTNGQWLEFVRAGGYDDVSLWLSEGWDVRQRAGWTAPAYWRRLGEGDDDWLEFGLRGEGPLRLDAPVTHVSLYEADAFARWAGARLPTEFEWEAVAAPRAELGIRLGNLVEDGRFEMVAPRGLADGVGQLFGDGWEWTSSAYLPYPGFQAAPGAVGEYNGKFMVNQNVLRGGSIATPRSHIRATYRNFFPARTRWQMTAVRLARSA